MSDQHDEQQPTFGGQSARDYAGDTEHFTENPELEERDPNAPEPGHLGNDLSKMTLIETDLEEIATSDRRESDPAIQQALGELKEATDRLGLPDSLDDD